MKRLQSRVVRSPRCGTGGEVTFVASKRLVAHCFVYFEGSGFATFYSRNMATFWCSIPLSGPTAVIWCNIAQHYSAAHPGTKNCRGSCKSRLMHLCVPRHTSHTIALCQTNLDGRRLFLVLIVSRIFLYDALPIAKGYGPGGMVCIGMFPTQCMAKFVHISRTTRVN